MLWGGNEPSEFKEYQKGSVTRAKWVRGRGVEDGVRKGQIR